MNLSHSSADAAATVTHSSVLRRTSQAQALFWPLCALLLSVCVVLALPGQRVALGASQLKGLVGSYTGHGNWLITVTTAGSATWQLNHSPDVRYGDQWEYVNRQLIPGTSVDLSQLAPVVTDTGGASSGLDILVSLATSIGSADAHLNLAGASINYNLQWLNSPSTPTEPAPKKVVLYYRRKITVSGEGGASLNPSATSATASYGAQGSIDSLGDSAADQFTAPPTSSRSSHNATKTDSPFLRLELDSSSGTVTQAFNLSGSANATSDVKGSQSTATGGRAEVNFGVDLCVAGFDMGRFGGATTPLGGGSHNGSSDPTYTRWLPLAFSPQMTSQPFRYQADALPGPWGNINCMYSLALRQEPGAPNYDLDGRALEYIPSLDGNGTYNNPGSPFTVKPSGFTPQYSLTDATGDRLLFDTNWNPNGNIHSTLTNQGNGFFQLTNAGPPGALREKGDYTYRFQAINLPGHPLITRLVSLADNLGNTQTLDWTVPNALTVTDSSSGRSLVFHVGANGYIGSVDAPEVGSGVHTHTVLMWDASGHCSAVKVYDGATNNLLHMDTFGYGGPNGDSIVLTQQGVSTLSYAFAADPLTPDPFGLPTPRLASTTAGSSGDSSSSDDGGSVAGTVSYTYGPQQQGYNNWGVSAHTNTVMDARGSLFTSIFQLSSDVEGDLVGMTATGPAFTGSLGANKVRTTYSPSMDQSQTTKVYDQLYYAGLSAQPWVANLDLLGNLTSVSDPLGNAWDFGYTADGKYLASILDPTGIGPNFSYGDRNNPAGHLTTISDPAAGTTQIDYNTFGQPSVITSPSAAGLAQTQATYNPTTGDLIQVLGPTNDALSITGYDALGDPLGVSVYPDTGSAATSLQPLSSSIVWNAAQQPSSATMASGVQSLNTWNNGVLTQVQCLAPAGAGGALLGQVSLSYDSRGRVYQTSDLVGTLGQYKYDKNNNLTRLIDGRGNATQFLFGSNNEPIGRIWADGVHQSSAAYDVAGRVRQTVDELGIVCNYVYDNAHRLTDIQWPNVAAENVHFGYDNAGRLLSVSDSSGGRVYAYNVNTGQLQSVTTRYSGLPAGSNTFVVSYSYYGDGSVSTMVSPVGTTSYQYNLAGEPTQLTDPWANVTAWSYDHVGRLTGQTTTAPGMTLATAYTWGVSGQAGDPSSAPTYLRQTSESVNGQTIWSDTLTHNYLGLLVGEQGNGLNGKSLSAQYNYDGRGRLSAQQTQYHPNAATLHQSSGSYSYDASGNLNGGANGWVYNSNNQLTSAPPSGDLPGATGLSYDAAGQMLTHDGMTLSYNCWGEVAQILNTAQGTASYAYDSSGRRIRKTVGGVVTYFLYEGTDLIAELDGSGAITRSYVWGAQGLISDHTGGGQGGQGASLLSEGARQLALGGSTFALPERHARFAACADFLALLQGNGSSDRFYTFDTQGSTHDILSGGVIIASPLTPAWGSGNLGDTSGSPFGYKGQRGAYTDQESQHIIYIGHVPYVPAAPTYIAPNALHDNNPYQPMSGNPVGSSAPYDEYAPVAGGPEDVPTHQELYKPFMDAANKVAGHLQTGFQFAADCNVFYQIGAIGIGQNASGHCVPLNQRILGGVLFAVGPFVGAARGPLHHIATNKNYIKGEQWTKFLKPFFDKWGVNMNAVANIIALPGHFGPHPPAYHEWVYNILRRASSKKDFLKKLEAIKDILRSNPTMANPNWQGPFPAVP